MAGPERERLPRRNGANPEHTWMGARPATATPDAQQSVVAPTVRNGLDAGDVRAARRFRRILGAEGTPVAVAEPVRLPEPIQVRVASSDAARRIIGSEQPPIVRPHREVLSVPGSLSQAEVRSFRGGTRLRLKAQQSFIEPTIVSRDPDSGPQQATSEVMENGLPQRVRSANEGEVRRPASFDPEQRNRIKGALSRGEFASNAQDNGVLVPEEFTGATNFADTRPTGRHELLEDASVNRDSEVIAGMEKMLDDEAQQRHGRHAGRSMDEVRASDAEQEIQSSHHRHAATNSEGRRLRDLPRDIFKAVFNRNSGGRASK